MEEHFITLSWCADPSLVPVRGRPDPALDDLDALEPLHRQSAEEIHTKQRKRDVVPFITGRTATVVATDTLL